MCIGIPMQVVSVAPGSALCEARGERRWIDTLLVGTVRPGDWLMTFLGSARETISAETARRSLDALTALDAAMRGEQADFDALFADLLEQRPPLSDQFHHEAPPSVTQDLSAFSPLARGLITRHGYQMVGADTLDAVAGELPLAMLFVAGDAERLGESDDAAVVLAELDKLLQGQVIPLIAARADERTLQRRFRFTAFPALVFLREGEYLGCIERVLDWQDYLTELPAILGREPHAPPAYRLPEQCAPAAPTAH